MVENNLIDTTDESADISQEFMSNLFGDDETEFEFPAKIKNRYSARELVVQMMYAAEVSGGSLSQSYQTAVAGIEIEIALSEFIGDLIFVIEKHKDAVTEIVKKSTKNWSLDRIAVIDKVALQMAISEMLYLADIPPKVSISQAIEIVKKFSTEESGCFVNGVLDAVYHQVIKPGEDE
ncbi:MAG: transcription antitermination factor NusB [Candidatus Marinimicrobia bacterium]|nr:transcription antitermination factor NusB [Candidatus Neomarinimicrobiota bacterium]